MSSGPRRRVLAIALDFHLLECGHALAVESTRVPRYRLCYLCGSAAAHGESPDLHGPQLAAPNGRTVHSMRSGRP